MGDIGVLPIASGRWVQKIQACAKISESIANLDTAIAELQLLLGPDYR